MMERPVAVELPERAEPAERPKARRAAIVSAAVEGDERVVVTARVQEDDGTDHEYTGSLAVHVLARLTPDEQRRALGEAVRLERDRVRRLGAIDLDKLVGDIEIW
jgi:hypothetical protein